MSFITAAHAQPFGGVSSGGDFFIPWLGNFLLIAGCILVGAAVIGQAFVWLRRFRK